MKTISAKEYENRYGGGIMTPSTEEPSFGTRAREVFKSRGEALRPAIEQAGGSFANVPELALNIAGQTAGTINDLVYQATPKFIREPLEKGVQKLAGTAAGQAVTSEVTQFIEDNPRAARDIGAAIEIAMAFTGAKGATEGLKGLTKLGKITTKATKTGAEAVGERAGQLGKQATLAIGKQTSELPEGIMNRVARLTPTDFNKFKKMSGGKTPGRYLIETGNFGSPDQIVKNEVVKFINSREAVDAALAKLPGEYKPKAISSAIEGLMAKGRATSAPGARSPFLGEIEQLAAKFDSQGLNMAEINRVKRIFEREIKLGYDKKLNTNLIEQANNIDSNIRNWQAATANKLGFTNIGELNQQTRVSKFLADALSKQITGKSGLDAVTLTDWVVLSGGNPQAIAGFFAKKLISAKSIQAKIAKALNKGEVRGALVPRFSTTPDYLTQTRALPAPSGQPSFGRFIGQPPTSYEPQAPRIPRNP